jgi:hypothetical protein
MISCVYLGNYGRHGNQMFQYAMTLSLAKKFDTIAVAPIENTTIKDCFVLGDVQNAVPAEVHGRYEEPNFGFDESVYNLPKEANIDLLGYFQTEKYFEEYSDLIKKNFEFRDEIKSQAELWRRSMPITESDKTVSIHVRRGDYLQLSDTHPPCEVEYYDSAMKRFEGYTPLIFSDDIEWCISSFLTVVLVGGQHGLVRKIMLSLLKNGLVPLDPKTGVISIVKDGFYANSSRKN